MYKIPFCRKLFVVICRESISSIYLLVLKKKKVIQLWYHSVHLILVRRMRLELTRETPYAPQTYASTNSATPALVD